MNLETLTEQVVADLRDWISKNPGDYLNYLQESDDEGKLFYEAQDLFAKRYEALSAAQRLEILTAKPELWNYEAESGGDFSLANVFLQVIFENVIDRAIELATTN